MRDAMSLSLDILLKPKDKLICPTINHRAAEVDRTDRSGGRHPRADMPLDCLSISGRPSVCVLSTNFVQFGLDYATMQHK